MSSLIALFFPQRTSWRAFNAWRLSPDHANKAKLILAVYKVPGHGRVILGAFRFGRTGRNYNGEVYEGDNFIPSHYPDTKNRYIFLAEPADPETWQKYVGHYIALPKPGEANPVRYIGFDK